MGRGGGGVRELGELVFTLLLSLSLIPTLTHSHSGAKAVFRPADFAFATVKDN